MVINNAKATALAVAFLQKGAFMNTKILLPKEVEYIIDTFYNAGYKAYAVGGCVRDSLMNKQPYDWDICTNALPEVVKQLFTNYNVIETGIKHGTVTLVIDKKPYEITTFRKETTYSDNRHPDSVAFVTSLEEDLSRRDFTINAMAYNHYDGLIDLFNGKADLQNKIIKAVGNPNIRFNEDALRILRALRFASTLEFVIEEETKKAIHKNKQLLNNIAKERIWTEFKKLMLGNGCIDVLRRFADVVAVIIPDITPMVGFKQNHPMHCFDVWEHTLHALDNAQPDLTLRLSVLFHDIGKPKTHFTDDKGISHFYGHNRVSRNIALNTLSELKVENKLKNDVATLVDFHDRVITPTEKSVKRTINKIGSKTLFEQLLQVKLCDIKAQTPLIITERVEEINNINDIFNKLQNDNKLVTTVKDLKINGNDIILLGVKEGKIVGKILSKLLNMVIDNKLQNNHNELLKMAEILKNSDITG